MKANRFFLAAGFSLALAFTFSCSSDDDKGGSTSACKYIPDYTHNPIEICDEISGGKVVYDKEEFKEDCEGQNGTYYDSCPGGYKLKCNYYNTTEIVYIYSDSFEDCEAACEQEQSLCK